MREVMMTIRAVFIEWQANTVSDRTAVQRIEKIILDNQKAEWLREHRCCDGNDPACTTHGVAASNARENDFYRRNPR